MLRRNLLLTSAAVPATALTLAACGSTGGLSPADLAAFIAKVRAGVSAACGFLPAVEGVLALLGALPFIGTVESVVNMICSALPPSAGAAPRAGQPGRVVVKGVTIDGVYVR